MRLVLTFVLLMVIWLLWSGFFKPLLISLGLLSCLLTLFLARRMGFFKREVFSLHLSHRLIPFWGWLAVELVKSNFEVARIVLSPKMAISPTVVQLTAQTTDPEELCRCWNSALRPVDSEKTAAPQVRQ